MDAKKKDNVISELNEMINDWVNGHCLFAGGCCFAAYGLAWYLSKLGIKYNVVLFQYNEILNARRFSTAINGAGVCHVAIEVVYKHKKFLIGRCDGIYDYFEKTGYEYNVCRYRGITPDRILDGYMSNEWNWMWDTDNNHKLIDDIRKIAEKYYSEI